MHSQATRRLLQRAAIMALGLFWVGCDDGKVSDSTRDAAARGTELSGTAAVGAPIVDATLTARCADGSTFKKTVTTDEQGRFEGEVSEGALPCALQLSGGSLPSGLRLHSFAGAEGTVNVTPLTDLILAIASTQSPAEWYESDNWQEVASKLEAAQEKLRDALVDAGYDVPEGDPFTSEFSATESDPWDQVLEELKAAIEADPDLEDYGDLVDSLKTGEVDVLPKAPGTPEEDAGMAEDAGSDPDSGMGVDAGPGENTVPAVVNAALVATYNLTFKVGGGAGCGSACSYVDEQKVTAVVGADQSLTIGGKVLTNPFNRKIAGTAHEPEIIWRDGNIEYALSDNKTGVFNEINVGDLATGQNGFPKFLGQLKNESTNGNALITQFAGSYTIKHQYQGDAPAWTGVTIGADGSFTFTGGLGPNLTAAQIGEVFDRLSCCGRVDVRATFDMNGDGMVNGTDRVSLFANGAGSLQALVHPSSVSTNPDVGVIVADVTALPTHDGTALPQDERVAGTVGESLISIPVDADPGASSSTNLTITASLMDNAVLQQRFNLRLETASALQSGQTYSCHEAKATASGRKTIRLDAKTSSANTSEYSSEHGGRCQITITDVVIGGPTNSSIESVTGRFVGELYPFKRNNPPIVIDDGVFRWVP